MDNNELLQQVIIATGEQSEAFEKTLNERLVETETRLIGEIAKLTVKVELLMTKLNEIEKQVNDKQ